MRPSRVEPLLGRLLRERGGNFAAIFAASLIPLLGFAGLATDYSKSSLVKKRMDVAIDAASLAALNKTVRLINEGNSTDAAAIAAGEREGRRYLVAQAAAILDGTVHEPSVEIRRDGATLTSTVSYRGSVPTVFSQLFGKKSFEVDGTSGASVTLPPFYDVHILVDVSASMGIGATQADMDILTSSIGCAFACHIIRPDETESSYVRGQQAGATVRMDVVRSALKRLVNGFLTDPSKRFRVAIYAMQTRTKMLIEPSNNLASVTAAINGGVQLASSHGGTNFHVAFETLDDEVPTSGDGLTEADAKSIVILMTDGVEDSQFELPYDKQIYWDPKFRSIWPNERDGGGQVQPIDPDLCEPMKRRDIRVIALNTKYVAPEWDPNPKFVAIRDWMHVDIDRNMKECVSSPGDYYDASSPADINGALAAIMNSISKPIALTQ